MGALLESGLVGNIGLKHLKVIKEDTINKWDKLGFLDGLKGHVKENMAQLYENQASHLINEAASTDSSGSFETVVFPIVRRVFSKLLANDLVSVQAMNLPIGKLFYFVPRIQGYSSSTDQTAANAYGGNAYHYSPVGSPSNTGTTGVGAGYPPNSNAFSKSLYDLFYEGAEGQLNPPGLFDYSKGKWSAVTSTATVKVWNNGALANATSQYPSGTNVRKVILELGGFTQAGTGKLIGPDGSEVDSETFLSDLRVFSNVARTSSVLSASTPCNVVYNSDGNPNSLLFRVVTQQYGKGIVTPTSTQVPTSWASTGNGGSYDNICSQDGKILLEVDLSCPVCADCDATSLDGYTGTTLTGGLSGTPFSAVWRRYANLEFEDQIGEVSFDLESVTVSVTERKLRAQWSPELAQDVSAFHNIDAEAELTALLSEQVAA
jgi:hypothetical protein